MITLAFDTCLDKMYVVLKNNDEVLSSEIIENHDNKYHSAFLISTIKNVMRTNNIVPADISLIAVNIGPGSFTGIRACVTTARVMAQELGCKAIGVSSLEILDRAYGKENSLVALDARKNAAYLYCDSKIKGAIQLEEVKNLIQTGKYSVLTDDKLQNEIGGKSYQKLNLKLGEALAELAQEKAKTTDGNWRTLKPLYIQPPPVY